MKWVVLAIVVVIVPYTFLTLRYRKEGPAFQPYQDMKNRANVSRLLAAGYQRMPLTAHRPADSLHLLRSVTATRAPGGLPAELKATLIEAPLLPTEILQVSAAPTANGVQAYPIQFTCRLPDDQQMLAGAELYLKNDEAVIVPTFERVGGDLMTRTREPAVVVTIPAGVLKPGPHRITVAAERSGATWEVDVR